MSLATALQNLDTGRDVIVSAIRRKGTSINENASLMECANAIISINSSATITSNTILEGYIGYDVNGEVVGNIKTVVPLVSDNVVSINKGYIAENTNVVISVANVPTISENQITVHKGYITKEQTFTLGNKVIFDNNTITPSKQNQTIAANSFILNETTILGDNNLISGNIKQGISIFGVEGALTDNGIDTSDATATSYDMLANKTAYVSGNKIIGNIVSIEGMIINPSTNIQSFSTSNKYLTGDVIVNEVTSSIDSNIIPENIKNGISILGVMGEYSLPDMSDANVTSSDILSGKIAYREDTNKNIIKVVGNIQTSTPTKNKNKVNIPIGFIEEDKSIIVGTSISGQTIVPSVENQIISNDSYLSGDVVILGDANLLPENIKANVSIFGIKGNHIGGDGISLELGQVVSDNGTLKYQGLNFNEGKPVANGNTEDLNFTYLYNILTSEPNYDNFTGNSNETIVVDDNNIEFGVLVDNNGKLAIQPLTFNNQDKIGQNNGELITDYELAIFNTYFNNEPQYGTSYVEKIEQQELTNEDIWGNGELECGVIISNDGKISVQPVKFNNEIVMKQGLPEIPAYIRIFETQENEPIYGCLEFIEEE